MPVMALLLIIQSSYLLAAAHGDDSFEQATEAAYGDEWKKVYELIDGRKADVNELYRLSDVPLIGNAISSSSPTGPEAVQELLNRGARLNIKAKQLPLMIASTRYLDRGDNLPIIELLLQSGAEPHFVNTEGVSTFNYVCRKPPRDSAKQATHSARKQELIKLFEQKAGINIKGSEE